MKEKELRYWGKVRSKGKWKYVLQYGLFLWGLIGMAFAILERLFESITSTTSLFDLMLLAEMFTRGIFYMVFAGPLYGLLSWYIYEKRSRKAREFLNN